MALPDNVQKLVDNVIYEWILIVMIVCFYRRCFFYRLDGNNRLIGCFGAGGGGVAVVARIGHLSGNGLFVDNESLVSDFEMTEMLFRVFHIMLL